MKTRNLLFLTVISIFIGITLCLSQQDIQPVLQGSSLIIPITDGDSIIAEDYQIFKNLYSDDNMISKESYFRELNEGTGEIEVEIYKIVQIATAREIFESFSSDLNELCLTPNHIAKFFKLYSVIAKRSCEIFFLFNKEGEDCIMRVQMHLNHYMDGDITPLYDSNVWPNFDERVFFVIPVKN